MNVKKHFSCLLTFLLIGSPAVIPTGLTVQADTNSATILNSDFEDNSVQGWTGGAASTEQKHAGSYSLKVNKIGGGYNIAGYDLSNKIVPGQTYSLDAWIYNPDTVAHKVDICANNIDASHQWNWAANSDSVAPGQWVELKGTFTYGTSFTYTAGKPTIYFESQDTTSFSCYVDDVVVTGPAPGGSGSTNTQTSAGVGMNYDFESGDVQNWGARGGAAVSNVTEEKNNGTHSLKITGRTHTWEGPIVDITNKVKEGVNYHFSAWVKYNDGPATKQFSLMTDCLKKDSTTDDYAAVGSAVLTKGQWTKIEGNWLVPTNLTSIKLYIETPFKQDSEVTADDTMDFYVDDVNIAQPGVVGAADFEDGTANSFTSVAGAKLSVSNTVYHSGSSSLKVSERTATYDGAQYSMLGKMEASKSYTVSAWVYQSSGSAQTMSMKMYRNDGTASYDSIVTKSVPTNTWTELKGVYTLGSTSNVSALNVYIESAAGTFDYLVDDFSVVDNNSVPSIETNIPSLFEQYSNYFDVGTCACVPDVAEGSLPAQLIAKHFNLITPGNEMKDDATEPTENHFDFTGADKIVNFAIANKKHVRGHTLVWHAQVPDWMFLKDASGDKYDPTNFVDKDTLLTRMKNHIDNVMGHYKDLKAYDGTKLIREWDVVNEAFDSGSKDSQKVRDTDYSNHVNRWYAILGADYIKDAFVYARQADPDAKLYYNDYGTEDPIKRQAMYDYVVKLKNEGLIDGVGLQSHIDMTSPSIAELEKTVKMFTDLGLEVRITELDITIRPASISNEVLVQQAYRYKAIFDMCKRYAHQTNGKGSVTGITIWGQTDDNTWLNSDTTPNNYPLLFDKNFKAKLAYWALVDPSKVPVYLNIADSANGTTDISSASYDNKWDLSKSYSVNDVSGQNVATFKTMWDNENLYIYGKVNDTSSESNDSVDIFLDQNNNKSTAIESDNRILHIDRKDSSKIALTSSNGSVFSPVYSKDFASVTETSGGYNFVGKIPLDLVTPAVGEKVGFDIQVNNGGTTTSWNDPQNLQWSNPSRYGTLSLVNAPNVTEAKYGTPTMDVNHLDPIWEKANAIETNVKVNDNSSSNTGKAKVRTLWDKDNLYVLAEVNDPVLSDKSDHAWEQDSVELFTDEDNSKGITFDSDDAQLRINYKNVVSTSGGVTSDKLTTVTSVVYDSNDSTKVTGYIVEAKIKFNKPMSAGSAIGFDAQVNDDKDGSGTRGSVYIWNDPSGNSYKDTSGFGVLRLSDENVQPVSGVITNPAVTPSPTAKPSETAGIEIDKIVKDNSKSNDEKLKAIQEKIQETMEKVSLLSVDEKQIKDGVAVLDAASFDELLKNIADTSSALSQKVIETKLNAVVEKVAVIDISKSTASAINLQQAFFDNMKSKAVEALTIKTKDAEILVKPDTIPDADKNNAKTITIQVTKSAADKVEGIESVYKKVIGDRTVYDFSMKTDVKAIHEFNPKNPVGITVPYTLGKGENEKDITVYYIDDKGNLQEVNANPVYNKITGKVSFTLPHFSSYVIMSKILFKNFSDVDTTYSWAKDSIDKMALAGIINGKSDSVFAPGENVTRAEFVKMLDGLYGIKPDGNSEFKDVMANKWYSPYIAVAEKAGIVKGTGNGYFSPDSPISRQDMCVMIVNAMKAMNKNVEKYDNNVLDNFTDSNLFSDYAKDSTATMVGMKLMQGGTDNKFGVKDNTLRAQAAVVLYRLFDVMNK